MQIYRSNDLCLLIEIRSQLRPFNSYYKWSKTYDKLD